MYKIEIGRGLRKAALEKETLLVKDVHNFEGHIACDAASNSELVIPIIKDENLIGVLDLDSEEFERFTEVEKTYLEKAVGILSKYIEWDDII